jgi:hypothetical protein
MKRSSAQAGTSVEVSHTFEKYFMAVLKPFLAKEDEETLGAQYQPKTRPDKNTTKKLPAKVPEERRGESP